MKINRLLWGILLFLVSCQGAPRTAEYVVMASQEVMEDSSWNLVAETLRAKHEAVLLAYRHHPDELLPSLKQLNLSLIHISEPTRPST